MSTLRAFFNRIRFSIRMDLLALVVVGAFIFMGRPVEEIKDIEHQGDHLFLAVGNHGVRVLDIIINPGNPREVGFYDTPGSASAIGVRENGKDQVFLHVADGDSGIHAFEVNEDGDLDFLWQDPSISPALDIAIYDKFAFVAKGERGLVVVKVDQKPPKNVDELKYYWEIKDVELDGSVVGGEDQDESKSITSARRILLDGERAYVLDNGWNLHQLNIENPKKPTYLDSYSIGTPVNDFVVYDGIVYIATEKDGLILLDLTNGITEINRYKGIDNVSSVSVHGAFAFIGGGLEGIQALEISNPTEEVFKVGEIKKLKVGVIEPLPGRENKEVSERDILYETINAGKMIHVKDYLYYSDGLRGVQTLETDQVLTIRSKNRFGAFGEEHGWVKDVVVFKEGKLNPRAWAYLAGGRRGLWILDVTDPQKPKDVTGSFKDEDGIANAIATRWEKLYVAYNNGVRIFSIRDPEIPVEIGRFEAGWEGLGIDSIDASHLAVAAGEDGLRIIDISDPDSTHEIGVESKIDNARGLTVWNNFAYVAAGIDGLQIVNVLDPEKPTLIATADTKADAQAVTVHHHKDSEDDPGRLIAYVADGSGGIAVIDVTNPQEPHTFDPITTEDFVQDVFVYSQELYTLHRNNGLIIYDVSDPVKPNVLVSFDTQGESLGIYVEGDTAYIADGNRGLRIIKVDNEKKSGEVGFFDLPTELVDLAIADNGRAFLGDAEAGIWTISLENYRNPIPLDLLEITGVVKGLALLDSGVTLIEAQEDDNQEITQERYAYVLAGNNNLYTIDISSDALPLEVKSTADFLVDAQGIQVRDRYVYVADGSGGVQILKIKDNGGVSQFGKFGTDGYAFKVDVAGNYLYAVTSNGQIDIANMIDAKDPQRVDPITPMKEVLANTQNIYLIPNREQAYVSAGENGFYIFDVSRPYDPKVLLHIDTPGTAWDVVTTKHYAFLADGTGGVEVIYSPDSTEFITKTTWYYGFEDEVLNVGGEDGQEEQVKRCNAIAIDAIPRLIWNKDNKDDDGYEHLKDERFLTHYVYVVTDNCGLITLEYTVQMEFTKRGIYTTPGDASFMSVVKSLWGVLKNFIRVLWIKSDEEGIGLIEIPALGRRVLSAQISALDRRIRETITLYVFGVFLFTVGIFYWLALFAYYVLPVRYPRDGWLSFSRLIMYFRGYHGPIEIIKEGRRETRELIPNRPGVALIDLHSAAVIEEYPAGRPRSRLNRLQRRRRRLGEVLYQSRVEGPGVVFLKNWERVRGHVDLRRQIRLRIQVNGQTRDGVEVQTNVYSIFTLGEEPEILKVTYIGPKIAENIRVITTRWEEFPIPGTRGKQRRVEVVDELRDELDPDDKREIHNFITNTMYEPGKVVPPEETSVRSQVGPYYFDEKRIFDAIVSRPYDPEDKTTREWTDLPAHVATGIFRNMINQELYNRLFEPMKPREFPILELRSLFSRRLRNQGVLAYRFMEKMDGKPIKTDQVWDESGIRSYPVQELKTPKPLRSRGMRVVLAGFMELTPTHKQVTPQLTRFWQSEWQQEATIKQADYDLQVIRIRNQARTQAQEDLVNTLSMILSDSTYTEEALALRVMQALEAAATDPETRRLLPAETINILERVHRLILPDDYQI